MSSSRTALLIALSMSARREGLDPLSLSPLSAPPAVVRDWEAERGCARSLSEDSFRETKPAT